MRSGTAVLEIGIGISLVNFGGFRAPVASREA